MEYIIVTMQLMVIAFFADTDAVKRVTYWLDMEIKSIGSDSIDSCLSSVRLGEP